jgi:hypothetical protein
MTKRPLSVTIISWVYLIAGLVGFSYHVREFKFGSLLQYDVIMVCFIRLLAVFGAIYTLRGNNWARWLLIAWMAYHVVLSAFHSVGEVMMHAALLALIGYFLLRRSASAFFRGDVAALEKVA